MDLDERHEFWTEWDRIHRGRGAAEAAQEAAEAAPWDAASREDLRTLDAHL